MLLNTKMIDILERLKNSSKINGAYPRDIADAIKEIEWLREEVARLLAREELIHWHLNPDKDGGFFLTEESYAELFPE